MAKQQGIALRRWSIDLRDYETEEDFRQAVASELASFEHIGERLGIGLVAAPIRRQMDGGGWFTAGWMFETATVPGVREHEPTADEYADLERALTGPEGALVEDVPEPAEA
jgi:hypothetical protein